MPDCYRRTQLSKGVVTSVTRHAVGLHGGTVIHHLPELAVPSVTDEAIEVGDASSPE